ncbi:hypothetical protein HB364_17885 [Pseudoflavitalea sp. X16]|uniref:hypothetical protein n=1 Tax=Paraflavitalea devenefica TaxID=2716334 RepID=UPI0014201D10|nr:hypothetical protein [Paraflavitalea devenefica]NII26966.1 hypothetical protein [Paraflavitalea devenefica]
MTNFTTRVELHQASAADYRQLILAMKKESFVTGNDKQTSGILTFKRRANVEIKEVIDAVVRAASTTGKKFSFTVMKDKPIDKPDTKHRLVLH